MKIQIWEPNVGKKKRRILYALLRVCVKILYDLIIEKAWIKFEIKLILKEYNAFMDKRMICFNE